MRMKTVLPVAMYEMTCHSIACAGMHAYCLVSVYLHMQVTWHALVTLH